MRQRGLLKNKAYSTEYRLTLAQRSQREFLFHETLSLVALLYASQIESGYRAVTDFGAMTGQSFNRELRFRNLLLESRINARKETKQKEQRQKEDALLEQLRVASQKK